MCCFHLDAIHLGPLLLCLVANMPSRCDIVFRVRVGVTKIIEVLTVILQAIT